MSGGDLRGLVERLAGLAALVRDDDTRVSTGLRQDATAEIFLTFGGQPYRVEIRPIEDGEA